MREFKYLLTTLFVSAILFPGFAQNKKPQLIFKDSFEQALDTVNWHVELQPSLGSEVKTEKGKLILKTGAGVTVWYKQKLSGNVKISYDRTVVVQGGAMDRLSDLNQFWMASDPAGSQFFQKNGVLESYNDLQLYYVGMGGNSNKTTRFRKYDGKGNRDLIAEYTDAAHLLKANQLYHIDLVVQNGEVSYWVDHEKYFSFHDPDVLKEGYFGFRSTKSNQEISALRIVKLP